LTELFTNSSSAVIDETGRYRYRLARRWSGCGKSVLFVMLNPSTADAEKPDPTIRRCVRFALDFGGRELSVVNLFAFRTPQPEELWAAARERVDIIGPHNDRHILEAVQQSDIVIAAWGVDKNAKARAAVVASDIEKIKPLHCLRITKGGFPEHPLFLPGVLRPIPYGGRA
jgi:hypothetical protein